MDKVTYFIFRSITILALNISVFKWESKLLEYCILLLLLRHAIFAILHLLKLLINLKLLLSLTFWHLRSTWYLSIVKLLSIFKLLKFLRLLDLSLSMIWHLNFRFLTRITLWIAIMKIRCISSCCTSRLFFIFLIALYIIWLVLNIVD